MIAFTERLCKKKLINFACKFRPEKCKKTHVNWTVVVIGITGAIFNTFLHVDFSASCFCRSWHDITFFEESTSTHLDNIKRDLFIPRKWNEFKEWHWRFVCRKKWSAWVVICTNQWTLQSLSNEYHYESMISWLLSYCPNSKNAVFSSGSENDPEARPKCLKICRILVEYCGFSIFRIKFEISSVIFCYISALSRTAVERICNSF